MDTVDGPLRVAPDAGEVMHTVTVYAPLEGVLEAHELLTVLLAVGILGGSNEAVEASWALIACAGAEKRANTNVNRMINIRLIPIYFLLGARKDSP